MASARAKLRDFLAWVRSATRASMSASVRRERGRAARGRLRRCGLRLRPRSRAARVISASRSSRTAKTPIEEVEHVQDLLDVALRETLPWSAAVLACADEIEDGGAGFGGVEVVGERGGEVVLGFARWRRAIGIVEACGQGGLAGCAGGRCGDGRRRWWIR